VYGAAACPAAAAAAAPGLSPRPVGGTNI
jgi:hypothetical protein